MSKKKKQERQQSTVKQDVSSQKKKQRLYFVFASLLIVAAVLVYYSIQKEEDSMPNYSFKKEGELSFIKQNGEVIKKIDIEVADTEYDRQLGLMFRKNMTENQGMLFVFPYEQFQSFWMRNTYISLDILFVNAQKEIVTIHKNTQVLTDNSYPSSKPAKYVVEVIAGFCDAYGVDVGDIITWD